MFPPVKRVMFHDRLEELIPTPVFEELPEDSSDPEDPVAQREDSGDASEGDDVPSTPVQGRRKRRREWVWTLGRRKVEVPPADHGNKRGMTDHGERGKEDELVVVYDDDDNPRRDHDAEPKEHETDDVACMGSGPASSLASMDQDESGATIYDTLAGTEGD